MFKPGDNIIVVDNDNVYCELNIGDKFIVYETFRNFVCIFINNRYLHYNANHFKLQIIEERKQKLEKLCSKQEM